jgi:hypothetical protein
MYIDYPDFYRLGLNYGFEDFSVERGNYAVLWYGGGFTATSSGTTYSYLTVPSGWRYYIVDASISLSASPLVYWKFGASNWLLSGFPQSNNIYTFHYRIPINGNAGDNLALTFFSSTIINFTGETIVNYYKTTGSKPEDPKDDTPYELFRIGDFVNASIQRLPDGLHIVTFTQFRKKEVNYMRISDYLGDNERVDFQTKLDPKLHKLIFPKLNDPNITSIDDVKNIEKMFNLKSL